MRGWNEYGHEDTPRFRSVFDCDHFPGDLRQKLRQEELMGTSEQRCKQYKRDNGDWIAEVDIIARQVWIPENFVKDSELPDLISALQAAQKELEAACPKT